MDRILDYFGYHTVAYNLRSIIAERTPMTDEQCKAQLRRIDAIVKSELEADMGIQRRARVQEVSDALEDVQAHLPLSRKEREQ